MHLQAQGRTQAGPSGHLDSQTLARVHGCRLGFAYLASKDAENVLFHHAATLAAALDR
jgi:hypothetical protein